jgi:hypothetical protein
LAPDQKYCVACGARSGKLPARIGSLVAALDMPAPPQISGVPPMMLAPPVAAGGAGALASFDEWVENFDYLSPRTAAVSVMALLAFGVLLGGVIGPSNGLSPVYVMPTPATAAAQTPVEPAAAAPAVEEAAAEAAPEVAPEEAAPVSAPTGAVTKVNHVWLIVLSGQGYSKSFGDYTSPSYLVSDLSARGAVVQNYYSVAQGELSNAIALVSGQGPTWQQAENCPNYTDLLPGTFDATTQQSLGDGCVFPDSIRTIGDAVSATGKTWSAYSEDIDNGAPACQPPAPGSAFNPFMYFKTIAASPNCAFEMYGLKALDADLDAARSPAFSMVIPNRCHNGSNTPCSPGAPAGLATSDAFLQTVVPKIMGSKDYLDGGVIAITFDQSQQGLPDSDTSGCCGQPLVYPNLANPPAAQAPTQSAPTSATGSTADAGATGQSGATGATGQTGPTGQLKAASVADGTPTAGGKVGLLLLSPMVKPGNTDVTDDYNHFSLLLSIENWFGTEKLGYTAQTDISALPDSLFNKTD